MTEAELKAWQVTKSLMDNMFADNMAMDEDLGNDLYARTHAALDTLEAKIEEKVQFENDVAYLREQYPNHSVAEIRKALRLHNKNQEG